MADDMPNGNASPERSELVGRELAFSERISNINRRQTDFEQETRNNFRSIDSTLDKMSTEFRTALANLSSNLADRNRPNIAVLAFFLSFAVAIGALAYWPIREDMSDLKDTVKFLAMNTVSRQEMDWRAARGSEERARTDEALRIISAALVPRTELDRVFSGYDQRLLDVQRQLDETKNTLGSTYSLRDYIQRLTERLDSLESRSFNSGG